jgi:stage III sporulation protein AE
MKKILICIVVMIMLIPSTGFAAENAAQDSTDGSQDAFGVSDGDFESALNDTLFNTDLSGLQGKYSEYLEKISGQNAADMIADLSNGDFTSVSPGGVLAAVLGQFLYGIRDNIPIMVQILAILLIMSILKQMTDNLGNNTQSVSSAAYYVGYIIICSLIVSIVFSIFNTGRDVVQTVSTFTEYLTPILFTLLTAIGGFTSASVLQPAITAFTGGVTQIITYYIFPALIVDMVFVLVGNLSSNMNLKGFSSLIDSVIKWSLGIIFIVFLGIVAIQGAGAGLFDGISIRTAKYTISESVPIVGGMFSESIDTVVACSALVKNAVGITGLLIIVAIILTPAINLIINIFLFKILSAISSPFSDKRSIEMIDGTSNVIVLLLVTVLTIGVMAFILVGILMGVGNINMMMR